VGQIKLPNWAISKYRNHLPTEILSGGMTKAFAPGGHPMLGSALVRDPEFRDRVVAETRALLSVIQKEPGRLRPLGILRSRLGAWKTNRSGIGCPIGVLVE
jgi:hypothetical protein